MEVVVIGTAVGTSLDDIAACGPQTLLSLDGRCALSLCARRPHQPPSYYRYQRALIDIVAGMNEMRLIPGPLIFAEVSPRCRYAVSKYGNMAEGEVATSTPRTEGLRDIGHA